MLGVVLGLMLWEALPLSCCHHNFMRTILKSLQACFQQVQTRAHMTTRLLFAYKRSSSKHCFATECVSHVVSSNVTVNTRIQSSIAKNWKVAYDGNWGWGRSTYSVNGPWAWFLSSLYLLQWGISVRMGCRPSCLSTCSINSGLATFTTTNGPYFDTHSGP